MTLDIAFEIKIKIDLMRVQYVWKSMLVNSNN